MNGQQLDLVGPGGDGDPPVTDAVEGLQLPGGATYGVQPPLLRHQILRRHRPDPDPSGRCRGEVRPDRRLQRPRVRRRDGAPGVPTARDDQRSGPPVVPLSLLGGQVRERAGVIEEHPT